MPQAILVPELPLGWVVKSSGISWIIITLPIISWSLNLPSKTFIYAYPLFSIKGGKSPAWYGWGHPEGLKWDLAFANSSSKNYGGAIYVQGNNATIQTSTFDKLTSERGGAIFVDGESSQIIRSSFDRCVATIDGGAININDVGTTVGYSNFTLSR